MVGRFRGRMINLHYALLPAFKGLQGAESVRQALAAGCKLVGSTVHEVAEEVDAGPILAQSAVAVTTQDLDVMMDRVFRSGCLCLLNVLAGPAPVDPGAELHAPAPALGPATFDEAFWRALL